MQFALPGPIGIVLHDSGQYWRRWKTNALPMPSSTVSQRTLSPFTLISPYPPVLANRSAHAVSVLDHAGRSAWDEGPACCPCSACARPIHPAREDRGARAVVVTAEYFVNQGDPSASP